jgi:hypothetical protein
MITRSKCTVVNPTYATNCRYPFWYFNPQTPFANSNPVPAFVLSNQTTINPTIPINPLSTTAVKIPAAALSLPVTGLKIASSALVLESEEEVPAALLPWLVPPVVLVRRPAVEVMRFDWMTERADICWPTP